MLKLVLKCELVRLVRDRRAVLFGLVVPAVAFPLLFLFSDQIGSVGQSQLEARAVRVVLDDSALDADAAAALADVLGAEDARIELTRAELGAPTPDEARELLEEYDAHLLVSSAPPAPPQNGDQAGDEDGKAATPAGPPRLLLYQAASSESAEEASDRVRRLARGVLRRLRDERLIAAVGEDPGARYEVRAIDVATPEDAAGHKLGALLPLLAALVLISGGSFAALDAFAGERESGTLETLFVQPVPSGVVAVAKFLAVLLVGGVAFLGNAASLLICLKLGLGELAAVSENLDWTRTAARIGFGCFLFLPTAALVAAVLAQVAARARTFRQGQMLTMPLTFAAMALVAPSMQSSTELGPLLAIVPLTGASLALRDAAAGAFAPLSMTLCFLASCGWAAFALSRIANTLDAERLLASPATSAEATARKLSAQRAIRFAIVASLLIYVVGGRLQSAWGLGGLMATLWGLSLGLALIAARFDAGRPPLRDALGLRMPKPAHALGAVLCAPALALAVERLVGWQQRLLPMPSSAGAAAESLAFLTELSPLALVFVMAISPGVCEELLFRGALLGQMRRDLRPGAVILWQAVLFGVVHASIYRFVPTAIVGAGLAAVALRARGVVPSMLLHTGYNAILVLATLGGVAWLGNPWLGLLALPGVALLALPGPRRS